MMNGNGSRLATAVCLLLCLASAELVSAADIAWRVIPQAALQEAQQSGRPLLVYVGTESCVFCRKLEWTTWSDERVSRTIGSGFVPLHIDGQRDAELARQLGVKGFPAVIVVSPAGKAVGRVDGYREPAKMQAFLVQHGVFRERETLGGR